MLDDKLCVLPILTRLSNSKQENNYPPLHSLIAQPMSFLCNNPYMYLIWLGRAWHGIPSSPVTSRLEVFCRALPTIHVGCFLNTFRIFILSITFLECPSVSQVTLDVDQNTTTYKKDPLQLFSTNSWATRSKRQDELINIPSLSKSKDLLDVMFPLDLGCSLKWAKTSPSTGKHGLTWNILKYSVQVPCLCAGRWSLRQLQFCEKALQLQWNASSDALFQESQIVLSMKQVIFPLETGWTTIETTAGLPLWAKQPLNTHTLHYSWANQIATKHPSSLGIHAYAKILVILVDVQSLLISSYFLFERGEDGGFLLVQPMYECESLYNMVLQGIWKTKQWRETLWAKVCNDFGKANIDIYSSWPLYNCWPTSTNHL